MLDVVNIVKDISFIGRTDAQESTIQTSCLVRVGVIGSKGEFYQLHPEWKPDYLPMLYLDHKALLKRAGDPPCGAAEQKKMQRPGPW